MEPDGFAQSQVELLPDPIRVLMRSEAFNLYRPHFFINLARDRCFDRRLAAGTHTPFQLPYYRISRKHLFVYANSVKDHDAMRLVTGTSADALVVVPVHPATPPDDVSLFQSLAHRTRAGSGRRMWALPTSSTRTLLVWPEDAPQSATFVKTSLATPIIGDRRIHRHRVAGAVGLSRIVGESLAALPENIHFFFEDVGFGLRAAPDRGTMVRSIPTEIRNGQVIVIPLFALLGGSGVNEPWFLRMAVATGRRVRDIIEKTMCEAFATLWVEMTFEHGLLLECHGQDLLLALSSTLDPTGEFYFRDFEGLQVDWELRARRERSTPLNLPNACAWFNTYGTLGFRYYQMVWHKLYISLYQYLHFFLNECDTTIADWESQGIVSAAVGRHQKFTALFSRCVRQAIFVKYGVSEHADYDAYTSLCRFVAFLMKVRKKVLSDTV